MGEILLIATLVATARTYVRLVRQIFQSEALRAYERGCWSRHDPTA